MRKRAFSLLAIIVALTMLCASALAEQTAELNYTVSEKLFKQLQAGSGFEGTLTVESTAVQGREAEALTTIQPLTFDVTYLYVRADSATQTDAESRWAITLMDGEKTLGNAEVSLQSGVTSLRSSLLGDAWVLFGGAEESVSAVGAIGQVTDGLASQSIAPGLFSFASGVLAHAHDVDFTKWDSVLETYTTKIDLWIEGYREGAKLGKAEDGTTTMEVNYTIPASALKAQLKQMVMDMLADQDLLSRLTLLIGTEAAQQYLNPELQSYYFYCIDELPVNEEMTISRTVSLKGDTLALSMALPLYDSQGGAIDLRYERHQGEGDLPDENTIELSSDRELIQINYQTYSTLTGTTVYQGTLLREPQGTETFEVGTENSAAVSTAKTLSVAFTLSSQNATTTDAQGKDTLSMNYELNLSPDYTPGVENPDTEEPTEAQKAQYVVFDPLDLLLGVAFSSGQAKNASTSLDATLTVSGDQMPETIRLSFSGKTRSKWTPEAVNKDTAIKLSELDAQALQTMLTQAGVKGGLLLLPYIGLPVSQPATETPATQTPTVGLAK